MAKYKFEEIAFNITEKKMPDSQDKFTYIGLEHLETGKLKVSKWGSEVDLIGQKLIMHKGDILFGRRNTYLRRVAIAPHDGIFSAHGMIWRPNEEIVDKDFFPFFIQSDYFMNNAIKISVGSLSPTVNWKDLKKLQFELPSIDKQRQISKILIECNKVVEEYESLLEKTKLLKSSLFEQYFGNEKFNYKINDVVDNEKKGQWGEEPQNDKKDKYVIKTNHLEYDGRIHYDEAVARKIDEKKFNKNKLEKGDLLIEKSGGTKDHPVGYVCLFNSDKEYVANNFILVLTPKKEIVNPLFLKQQIQYLYEKKVFNDCHSQTTGIQNLKVNEYLDKNICLPKIEDQNKFAKKIDELDKAEDNIYRCLNLLKQTSFCIINEVLS